MIWRRHGKVLSSQVTFRQRILRNHANRGQPGGEAVRLSKGGKAVSERTSEIIEAGVFDFDGTLVDTLSLHYQAYRLVFAEVGLQLTEQQFYSNIGGTALDVIPRLVGGRRCPVSASTLHTRKLAYFPRVLDGASLELLPSSGLLPVLHGNVPLAVATSGARDGFERLLAHLGWEHYFAATVTGDDVEYGKPHPEPYLLAASRLGVEPRGCLAFEDTEDGLSSARAAGMLVVDVRPWGRSSGTGVASG